MRYDADPVHEGYELLTERPLGQLRSAIWQFPFRNLEEVIRKMNRYSSLGARKLASKRVSMGSALGHGIWAFIKHYVLKRGYRDGWAGFVIALGNFEGTFTATPSATRTCRTGRRRRASRCGGRRPCQSDLRLTGSSEPGKPAGGDCAAPARTYISASVAFSPPPDNAT